MNLEKSMSGAAATLGGGRRFLGEGRLPPPPSPGGPNGVPATVVNYMTVVVVTLHSRAPYKNFVLNFQQHDIIICIEIGNIV